MRIRRALLLLSLCALSCAELDAREPNVCGNGLVEPESGEDCDGADGCIGPGVSFECWWSCEDQACPEGFGCGVDGVCRAPGLELEPGPTFDGDRVAWLEAADLDLDGRDDLAIVQSEPLQAHGNLEIVFIGPDGDEAKTLRWSAVRSRIALGDADADGLVDLLLTSSTEWIGQLPDVDSTDGLSVLRNDGERGFLPALTPLWRDAEQPGGLLMWRWQTAPFTDPLEEPAVIDGSRLERFLSSDEELADASALATSLHAYAEDKSEFDEFGDDPRVRVLVVGDDLGNETFAPEIEITLEFEEGAPTQVHEAGFGAGVEALHPFVSLVDVDGDGILDIVANVARRYGNDVSQVVVLWGQPDRSFHGVEGESGSDFTFGPAWVNPEGSVDFSEASTHALLTAGDFNADAKADFVWSTGVAVSGDLEPDCEFCCGEHHICTGNGVAVGTDAQLWDSQGDDSPELAVVGETSVVISRADAFNGDEEELELHEVQTIFVGDGAAEIEVVDADGDGLEDLLIRRKGPGGDELWAVWGSAGEFEVQRILAGLELHPGILGGTEENGLLGTGTINLAAAREGQIGLAALVERGRRLLAGVVKPSTDGLPDSRRPTYQSAVAGHFSSPDATQLALGVTVYDKSLAGDLPSASTDGFDLGTFARQGPWFSFEAEHHGGVVAELGDLPPIAAATATQVAVDLDGSGTDELVVVGALDLGLHPLNTPTIELRGGTFVASYRYQPGDGWVEMSRFEDPAGPSLGGVWPFVSNPHPVAVGDVDGDGDPDVIAFGPTDGGESEAVVLLNRDGVLEPSGRIEATGWQALEVLGPNRIALVADDALQVGRLDVETMQFEAASTRQVPGGTSWSTTGDFNGDGLLDLALGSNTGTALYLAVPTHIR